MSEQRSSFRVNSHTSLELIKLTKAHEDGVYKDLDPSDPTHAAPAININPDFAPAIECNPGDVYILRVK